MKATNRSFTASAVICTLILAPIGCTPAGTGNGNQNDGSDTPPDLPPVSSMVTDFSDFDGNAESKIQTSMQMIPGSNWNWAAGNVLFWNGVLTVTLIVPVTAFVESFNHEPTLDGEVWVWAYDVNVGAFTYSARLEAELSFAGVDWTMYISQQNGFSEVVWFTGFSNLSLTEGNWTLNRDPDNAVPFIQIDWMRDDNAEEVGNIRYTNVTEGAAANGSYIFAEFTDEETLNALYEIYNAETDNTTLIQWNRTDKAGQVQDVAHFGTDEFQCWDTALQNVDCAADGGTDNANDNAATEGE